MIFWHFWRSSCKTTRLSDRRAHHRTLGQIQLRHLGNIHRQFKVSDSTLDQFAPGTYQGEFWVNRIYYKTSPWRSGLFIQLMAEIARDGYVIQRG